MLQDFIKENKIGDLFLNYSLKELTTFKIGGICKYYLLVNSFSKLSLLLKYLKTQQVSYFIIGNGSNLLIEDGFIDALFISLNKQNKVVELSESIYIFDAGVKANALGLKILKKGYLDALPLVLIPGTIGGLVYMNASCFKKSMDKIVRGVICLDAFGNIVFLKDLNYQYRKSILQEKHLIVLKVILEFKEFNDRAYLMLEKYQKIKKNTQPMNSFCAGSIFQNGDNFKAWEVIDRLSLRGFSINDAQISSKHTNFFINKKHATFNEMLALIYYVKTLVYLYYKINLKTEIKIITSASIAYTNLEKPNNIY